MIRVIEIDIKDMAITAAAFRDFAAAAKSAESVTPFFRKDELYELAGSLVFEFLNLIKAQNNLIKNSLDGVVIGANSKSDDVT